MVLVGGVAPHKKTRDAILRTAHDTRTLVLFCVRAFVRVCASVGLRLGCRSIRNIPRWVSCMDLWERTRSKFQHSISYNSQEKKLSEKVAVIVAWGIRRKEAWK